MEGVFAKYGTITQLKVFHKRRFAFVGFQTEDQARRAQSALNNSYIDISKIDVRVLTYSLIVLMSNRVGTSFARL